MLQTTITNFNTNNLTKFDSAFRYSAFTSLIDDTDDAITSNITTVKLSKDFTPTFKYINKIYNSI